MYYNEFMRILLIEDEKPMAQALSEILRTEQYETDTFLDGVEGNEAALSGIYDLIILDVMLPGKNGYAIAKDVRSAGLKTPILMLTARTGTDDKVEGLDSGADDYLTKPFETKELLARIRALIRRGEFDMSDEKGDIVSGKLRLSKDTLMLANTANSTEIRLSEKEYHIMEYLMLNKGKIISKENLALKIWGYENETEYNNVEVYISFTRKKLKFVGSDMEIKAVRGIGYELRQK